MNHLEAVKDIDPLTMTKAVQTALSEIGIMTHAPIAHLRRLLSLLTGERQFSSGPLFRGRCKLWQDLNGRTVLMRVIGTGKGPICYRAGSLPSKTVRSGGLKYGTMD